MGIKRLLGLTILGDESEEESYECEEYEFHGGPPWGDKNYVSCMETSSEGIINLILRT